MKSTNHSPSIHNTNNSTANPNLWTPKSLATIRTTARDYANPVDYEHPYPSMARFADHLALRYDANRTRHSYYRQLRLIHEHFGCDPATITEAQLRDYFLFVKLKKHWTAQNHPPGPRRRQHVLCRSLRTCRLDRLFPDPHQRSRHPARRAHPPASP